MNLRIKETLLMLTLITSSAAFAKDGLVVHEWGTFTSLFGSDGTALEGMHREEEPLPNFVYGYNTLNENGGVISDIRLGGGRDCPINSKNCEAALLSAAQESLPVNPIDTGITQKMETPVIYFYGKEGQKVNISVDFPEGLHSQFFPMPTTFSPKVGEITSIGPSQINYNLTLLSPNAEGIPTTLPGSIWNPAREVADANVIDVNGEREKFIFYRGVGNFKGNLTVSSTTANEIQLNNLSGKAHRSVFILNVEGDKAAIRALKPNAGTMRTKVPVADMPMTEFLPMAKHMVAKALTSAGLHFNESMALVNTWEKSYFKHEGPRILYILHDQDVERILPMKITPAPTELKRVLVGRLEFLTKSQEEQLLKSLIDKSLVLFADRFAEPKLRRLQTLVNEAELSQADKDRLQNSIKQQLQFVRSL